MNTKNLLDINKAIEKAFAEQYPAGWTDQEMKDMTEDFGYEDVKHYNLDTKGSVIL